MESSTIEESKKVLSPKRKSAITSFNMKHKVSPLKQAVTLSHQGSVLRAHKQSSNSLHLFNDENSSSSTLQQQHQLQSPLHKSIKSMAKQINQHKSPQQRAQMLQQSISFTNKASTATLKVVGRKQVTSVPAEPKLVSQSSVVSNSASVVLIPSRVKKGQTERKSSNGIGSLPLPATSRNTGQLQLKNDSFMAITPIKEEDVPESSRKNNYSQATADFTWYVKQKNINNNNATTTPSDTAACASHYHNTTSSAQQLQLSQKQQLTPQKNQTFALKDRHNVLIQQDQSNSARNSSTVKKVQTTPSGTSTFTSADKSQHITPSKHLVISSMAYKVLQNRNKQQKQQKYINNSINKKSSRSFVSKQASTANYKPSSTPEYQDDSTLIMETKNNNSTSTANNKKQSMPEKALGKALKYASQSKIDVDERKNLMRKSLQTPFGISSCRSIPEINRLSSNSNLGKRKETLQATPSDKMRIGGSSVMGQQPVASKKKKPLQQTSCRKQQRDVIQQPKGAVKKAYIQVSASKNPEETHVLQKQDSSRNTVNSSKQLLKAKTLMHDQSYFSQAVRKVTSSDQQFHTAKRASSTMKSTSSKTKRQDLTPQSFRTSSIKRRTMGENQTQMQQNVATAGTQRQFTTPVPLSILISDDESKDQKSHPFKTQTRSSYNSIDLERFDTQDREPIASVPQVKISLKDFSDKVIIEEQHPDMEQSSLILAESDDKSQQNQSNSATPLRAYEDNTTNSYFDKQILAVEQTSIKMSQIIRQQQRKQGSSLSIQYNTCLRQQISDPYQQGGGCVAKDGQRGGNNKTSDRKAEIDTSTIPLEDCGTSKSTNILTLERSTTSLSKPTAILSPKLRKNRKNLSGYASKIVGQNPDSTTSRKTQQFNLLSGPYHNSMDHNMLSPTRNLPNQGKLSLMSKGSNYLAVPQSATAKTSQRFNLNSHLRDFNLKRSSQLTQNSMREQNNSSNLSVYKQPSGESNNYQTQTPRAVKSNSKPGYVQSPPATLRKKQSFTRNDRLLQSQTTGGYLSHCQYRTTLNNSATSASASASENKKDWNKTTKPLMTENASIPEEVEEQKIDSDINNDRLQNNSRMSIGLGHLFETAKSFKKNNSINLNPMFESIKKSFQNMLGSSDVISQEQLLGEQKKQQQEIISVSVLDDYATKTTQQSQKDLHANALIKMPVPFSADKVAEQLKKEIDDDMYEDDEKPMKKMNHTTVKNYNNLNSTEPQPKEEEKESLRVVKRSSSNENISDSIPVSQLPELWKMKSLPRNYNRQQNQLASAQNDIKSHAIDLFNVNPMLAASDCLLQFGHLLTPQEKSEILSYQEVYFVGTQQAKLVRKTQLQQCGRNNSQQRDRFMSNITCKSPTEAATQNNEIAAANITKTQQPAANSFHNRNLSMDRSRGGESLSLAMYGPAAALGSRRQGANNNQSNAGASQRRRNVHISNNHGYDTPTGFYQVINGDHLDYRYETLQELGRGTFGQVLRCLDHKTGFEVAIKMTKNLSYSGIDNCMREVRLLQQANSVQTQHSDRIVNMISKFKFRQHLCMVFELLDGNDLYREIKQTKMQGFSEIGKIKMIVKQIVEGLCHLKECGILHCDLKPENILFSSPAKESIKIVDLGSACSLREKGFTYVCSRYYRAPEMVLSKRANYDFQVDIWSLGCIAAELYNGIPLFLAQSQNELIEFQSLYCGKFDITELLNYDNYKPFLDINTPSGEPVPIPDLKQRYQSVKPKVESSLIKEVLCRKKRYIANEFQKDSVNTISMELTDDEILGKVSQDERLLIDFIICCLQLKPWQRMTCEAALQHPFIAH